MSNEPNKSGTKPAIQHSKSILDDRRIRLLLAVVGAIVAWMVVTIVVQPGTTKTIANVPVDFTYDSAANGGAYNGKLHKNDSWKRKSDGAS